MDDLSLTVNNGNDSTSTTITGLGSFTANNFVYNIANNALNHYTSTAASDNGDVDLGISGPVFGVAVNDPTLVDFILVEDGAFSNTYSSGATSGDYIAGGLAMYNVTGATAVPFEFSPSLGLLALGGLWGVSEVRKRIHRKG